MCVCGYKCVCVCLCAFVCVRYRVEFLSLRLLPSSWTSGLFSELLLPLLLLRTPSSPPPPSGNLAGLDHRAHGVTATGGASDLKQLRP